MLLRSSSTPILKSSWLPTNNYTNLNSSPNNINERTLPSLPRNNSISTFTTTSSAATSSPTTPYNDRDRDHSKRTMCTFFAETDLCWDPPRCSKMTSLQRMFSISDLDEEVLVDEDGGGGDGGGIGHGGRSGSGFNDYDSKNGDNDEYGNMEAYYQKMIKENPADPLLLGNYARFLKQVQGNLAKAEEYCERAILGSPSDANLLALYADVLWQHRGDAQRAESYFDQAVQAAPNNCYVHASYANFLWELEEDEAVVEEESQDKVDNNPISQSSLHLMEETS